MTASFTVLEAEMFEAGNEVFVVTEDEQKIALPIGEYEMEDGRILVVVEEGIISEIKEKEEEEEEMPESVKILESKSQEYTTNEIQDFLKTENWNTEIPF